MQKLTSLLLRYSQGTAEQKVKFIFWMVLPNALAITIAVLVAGFLTADQTKHFSSDLLRLTEYLGLVFTFVLGLSYWLRNFTRANDRLTQYLLHFAAAWTTLGVNLVIYLCGSISSHYSLWLAMNAFLLLMLFKGRQLRYHLIFHLSCFLGFLIAAVFNWLPYAPVIVSAPDAMIGPSLFWVICAAIQIFVLFASVGLSFIVVLNANDKLATRLQKLSITDSLTGLRNRYLLEDTIDIELQNNLLSEQSLSLLMLDIDHFKGINDNYGHQVGDKVIVQVAKILKCFARKTDHICRYGGEEFLVLLPDTTNSEAMILAERYRKLVENKLFSFQSTELSLTISVGISSVVAPEVLSADELIDNADKALYQAKQLGRNQVINHESQ